MSLHRRILGDVNSSTKDSDNSSSTPNELDSEFVVILAALLCALVCVLGVVAVARCSWIRRNSDGRSSPPLPANKGLQKKIIDSLPKLTYSAEHAVKLSKCVICLTEFVAGDEIRKLPQCGHGFHVACIDRWLESHSSCPSCRQMCVAASSCQKCGEFPVSSVGGDGLDQRRIVVAI